MIIIGIILSLFGGGGLLYVNSQTGTTEDDVYSIADLITKGGYQSSYLTQLRTIRIFCIAALILGVLLLIIGIIYHIVKSTNKKQRENNISQLFHPDIAEELYYVFDKNIASSIKNLPKVKNDHSWVCSCDYTNSKSECPICGMKLEDAKMKLNYTYLNNHRIERLKQKKLRKKEILNIKKEKIAYISHHILNKTCGILRKIREPILKAFYFLFSKKNRLKSSIIIGLLIVVISSIIFLPKTPAFKVFSYNSMAESNISKDNEKATSLFLQSLEKYPTIKAYTGLFKVAMIDRNYKLAVQYLTEFSSVFPNDKSIQKCLNQMLENAEQRITLNSSIAAEIFSETLQFKPTERAFTGLIQIYVDQKSYAMSGEYIREAISTFPENEDYKELLGIYTPEAPAVSMAEGTYNTFQTIEISAPVLEYDNHIYYKMNDGPDMVYQEAIKLDQNQKYQLETWSVNAFQIESEHKKFTYKLNLPVPSNLSVNLKGGTYNELKSVKITSPEGYPVYYTLNGSQPDKNSLLYTGPVALDFGTTVLKAVCYNDFDMESKSLNETYQISYEVHGALFSGGYFYSGYYYDYFARDEGIKLYTKSGEYINTLPATADCSFLNEYGKNLYYLFNGDVMAYNIVSFRSSKLSDIKASGLAVAHDYIYYIDATDGYLYRMDLDGSNKTLVLNKVVGCMDVADQRLYFNIRGEGVSYIAEKDGEILPTILNKDVSAYYFGLDVTYYIDSTGFHKLTKDGDILLVLNNENNSKVKGRGLFSDSHKYLYKTSYDVFIVCKTRLYFRKFHSEQDDTISWTNVVKDTSKTAGYSWFQYNLKTGLSNETAVNTFDLYVTHNAFYDQNLTRYGVIR